MMIRLSSQSSPSTRRVARYVVSSLLLTSTLSRSSSRIQTRCAPDSVLHTRGGYTEGGESSAGEIDDDELDEYIEFLLQAAERKVTERENPLYKRFQKLVGDLSDTVAVAESSGEGGDQQILLTSDAEVVAPLQDVDGTEHVTIPNSPQEECQRHQESDSIDSGTLEMLFEESIDTRNEDVIEESGVAIDTSTKSDEPSTEVPADFIAQELQPVEEIQGTIVCEGDISGLGEEADNFQDPELVPAVAVDNMANDEELPEKKSDSTLVDAIKALESTNGAAHETSSGDAGMENSSVQEYVEVDDRLVWGDQGVSEVGAAEKLIQMDHDFEQTQFDKKLATEFFLGPSAVGESPAVVEEVALAVEETTNAAEVHDIIGTASEEASVGGQTRLREPGMLGDAMRRWGGVTARLLGVRHIDGLESEKSDDQGEMHAKPLEPISMKSPSIENPSDLVESTSDLVESTVPFNSKGIRTPDSPSSIETQSQSELSVNEASIAEVKSSLMNNTMSSWGRLTASVIGIQDQKNVSKRLIRTPHYARRWGRWTASLMGIDPPSKIRRRPKKNYDRIYDKYFSDFEYQDQDCLAGQTSDAGAVDQMEQTPEIVSDASAECDVKEIVELSVATVNEEDHDPEINSSLDFSLVGEMPPVLEKTTPNVEDETPVDAMEDIPAGADIQVGDVEVSCTDRLHEGSDEHHMQNEDAFDDDLTAKLSTESCRDDDGDIEDNFEDFGDIQDSDTEDELGPCYSAVSEPVQVARVVDPMVVMEAETMNFFYRFLVARGLDVWLLTIVLLVEWARVYLSPFTDVFIWALSSTLKSFGRASLEEKLMARIRGGSLAEEFNAEDDTQEVSNGDKEEVEDASLTPIEAEEHGVETERSDKHRVPVIRTRPNRFYQHLFTYGRVGHVVIMACVLLQEWVDTYLPLVGISFRRMMAESFPSLLGPRELSEAPISQTTGFVGADGTAVRGAKKRKSQLRKEDQKALYQLTRVGNVATAKYRFVSEVFMKRHGLGLFASERENSSIDAPTYPRIGSKQKNSHSVQNDEAESDSEWIMSALTKVDDTENIAAIGASSLFTDRGPTVAIDVRSAPKRPDRKRPAITNVAKIKEASAHIPGRRKNSGPRVSDRESGVMGRIRAAGANSLVGRSLLGAYPGDVPSPNEAGNPHGLFDLAERYGYGEWSDSEDETAPRHGRGKPREKVRNAKDEKDSDVHRRSRRRRKKSSLTVGLEFEFGGANTSRSRRKKDVELTTTPRRRALSPAKVTSVRQAAVDAVAERASKRRKQDVTSSSESKDSGNGPTSRLQNAASGKSTVSGAGLQQLKEKLETSHQKED